MHIMDTKYGQLMQSNNFIFFNTRNLITYIKILEMTMFQHWNSFVNENGVSALMYNFNCTYHKMKIYFN